MAALTAEGLLEVRPGIGTVVAAAPEPSEKQCQALLGGEVERLVVEARKLGLGVEQVIEAIKTHWKRLR